MNTALLRQNRDYVRLWSASLISNLGSHLSLIAFPLLVLSLGGNAAQAGAVGSCSLVTGLALRLPGGHIVDRVNRRRLMLGADLVRLLALGSIPLASLLHALGYPQLLVVATVEGAMTVLFGPAAGIALRDVVPLERLTEAFAISQARSAAIDLVGPALGGALFGVDRLLPFALDAASYGLSAVLLLSMRTAPRDRTTTSDKAGIMAGVRWLWHRPDVIRILLFSGVINLAGAAADVVVVVSLHAHGAAGATIGVVMACAGGGALVGSMVAVRLVAALRSGVLIVSGAAWAVGFGVFAMTGSAWVIGPFLVLLMIFTPANGILLGDLTLGRAPADILGRVTTAERFVTAGLASVGPVLAGVAVQSLGAAGSWVALALLAAAATAIAAAPNRRDTSAEPMAEIGN